MSPLNAANLKGAIQEIARVEHGETLAYRKLQTEVANTRASVLKRVMFSPLEAVKDAATFKALDHAAATDLILPTDVDALSPTLDRRFDFMAAYLHELANKIPG